MSLDKSKKKLFKVASEYNVTTQSIVDVLNNNGFLAENKPNFTITPDMYEVLDKFYGEDKAKSKEHERSRGEYENRRSAILGSRNEKITLDTVFSDPIADLAPIDDSGTLAPLEEMVPLVPEETAQESIKVDTSSERKVEAPKVEELQPVVAEIEPVVEPEEEVESTSEEIVQQSIVDDVDHTTETVESDVSAIESEVEVETEPIDEVIRARADRLKGTRVIGRIDVSNTGLAATEEDPAKKKKKKKKKLIQQSRQEETKPQAPVTTKTAEEESADKKNKKKKVSGKKGAKVTEEDVDSKMKETMALLQGGAGKKRQKRRKLRRDEIAAEREIQDELDREMGTIIELTEYITVSDLADLFNVPVNKVITSCMALGMFVSINQRLDASSIELIAAEFNQEIRFVDAERLTEEIVEDEDLPEDLVFRAPVVTVMGHVDHGKTSLLDYIRKTKVTAGESGGITQHIGAYEVKLPDGRRIAFLDTPGHEAFTAMRARGAQATDIVILVVAADDRVMPQTIEAINHAQAGGVPIVVALNKMDKAEANPDKIRQQLADHNVIVEEWGGKAQCAEVSAHSGNGIDELLEKVLIEAELMDLRANPNRRASGVVLETKVDKGKGVVANVLIQKGTLRVGDPFVAGQYSGRVRLMENEFGEKLDEAGPSRPIQLTGFDGLPLAGDKIVVTQDDKTAKEIATQRQQIKREQDLRKVKHLTLDDIARRMALGNIVELNLIIKGDVDGSIEALSGSLQKISTEEVKVNIIHTGVGAISESDVLLASASDAVIIGFQVRPTTNARKLAEREEIDVRLFSVIYDAIDAVKDALEGMLSPELGEKIVASIDIRETFKVPNIGTIAGCYVTEGKINRNTKVRLIRDGIVIYDGVISSLKRFKDDVREVAAGYECGIGIHNYNDLRVKDVIEGYEITETKRKLNQ
jgi:translation initiation factor IF-2